MPLEMSWPMTSSFADVPSLQANGSSGATGALFPAGIPGRLDIVRDPLGRGNVMRSTLYETDEEAGNGLRSEIANTASGFSEYWYSWRMMLDHDWTDLNEPFSLMQMHDTPDGGDAVKTPNLLFAILSGHFRVIVPDPLPTENQIFNRRGGVGAELMRWYRICVHANWKSSGVAGFREVFVDGVPIYREHNVVTSYDDVAGPFLKLGVYDGLNAAAGYVKRTAYYSDIRVWSGAANHIDGMGVPLSRPARVTKQ